MTLIMPQIGGFYAGASGPTVTLNESNQNAGGAASSYSVSIDAGTGGFVVMVFGGRESSTGNTTNLTSVTIDGITASTLFVPCANNAEAVVGMAYASGVSSGTVTAVVTFSANTNELRWSTYAISGLISTTPHDTATTSGTGTDTGTVSLDIPAGGVLVAGCQWSFSEPGDNIAWTGATEDFVSGSVYQLSSASASGLAEQTGRSVSVTASSDDGNGEETNFHGIIAASWG